jgi:hypothetical protein
VIIPAKPRVRSCDTVVVAAESSATGRTLFGKNSDRHPNEAQYLTLVPGAEHAPGTSVDCTFVSVPQVARTARVVGSRPWWMWGFEHGVNEHGVAMGNEALWSKLPPRLEAGLLGMDLLRLTLERSTTADEALECLLALVEEHGQSGPTNTVILESYDNGFVIADPSTAWLVQTAGRHWVAKRVTGVAAMSNLYTIGSDYTRISDGAVDEAVARGWFDPDAGTPFDFARAYGDEHLPDLDGCARRFDRSSHLLQELERSGRGLRLRDIHQVLRDLGDGPAEALRPGPRSEGAICMYAQDPAGSETAATIIAELDAAPELCRIGVSASAPRHAGLIQVWVDLDDFGTFEQPVDAAGADLWWETERLQRRIEAAFPAFAPIADSVFDRVNRRFFSLSQQPVGRSRDDRQAVFFEGEARHRAAVAQLTELFEELGPVLVEQGDADLRGDHLARLAALVETTTVERSAPVRERVLADAQRHSVRTA